MSDAQNFPAYPLSCVPHSAIQKIARVFDSPSITGINMENLAQKIDEYCGFRLGFDNLTLNHIRAVHPTKPTQTMIEAAMEKGATTRHLQRAIVELGADIDKALPECLPNIHSMYENMHYRHSVQQSGRPNMSMCDCTDCITINAGSHSSMAPTIVHQSFPTEHMSFVHQHGLHQSHGHGQYGPPNVVPHNYSGLHSQVLQNHGQLQFSVPNFRPGNSTTTSPVHIPRQPPPHLMHSPSHGAKIGQSSSHYHIFEHGRQICNDPRCQHNLPRTHHMDNQNVENITNEMHRTSLSTSRQTSEEDNDQYGGFLRGVPSNGNRRADSDSARFSGDDVTLSLNMTASAPSSDLAQDENEFQNGVHRVRVAGEVHQLRDTNMNIDHMEQVQGATGFLQRHNSGCDCKQCEIKRIQGDCDETEIKSLSPNHVQYRNRMVNEGNNHSQTQNNVTNSGNNNNQTTVRGLASSERVESRDQIVQSTTQNSINNNQSQSQEYFLYSRDRSNSDLSSRSSDEKLSGTKARYSDPDITKIHPACTCVGRSIRRRPRRLIFVSLAEHSNSHTNEVLALCRELAELDFEVRCDMTEDLFRMNNLNRNQWIDDHFNRAAYVLFCISPKYQEFVSTKWKEDSANGNGQAQPHHNRFHTRYIFDRARSEYINNGSLNYRFLPVIFRNTGATKKQVPEFLHATLCYTYPDGMDLRIFLLGVQS